MLPSKRMKDIGGIKFGALTAVSYYGLHRNRWALWKCLCNCGKEKIIPLNSLTTGKIKSCGCSMNIRKPYRHGENVGGKKSREYNIWWTMKQRCLNKNYKHYKYYGERGIGICDRWKDSVVNFIEDMGRCQDGLSLERINNDGNYDPYNCKWATKHEQSRNKRNNVNLEYCGETMICADWADLVGVHRRTMYSRIKRGWTLTQMIQEQGVNINA